MGSHKDRPQITRLEIVDTGRRRRWSEAEKQRIIEESFSGRRLVSATARAHGISRSLLTTWRRLYREGRLGQAEAVSFGPVLVAATPLAAAAVLGSPEPRIERIEILLMNGRRLLVGMDVDAAALARVVSVLERA
jgi:transposase